VGGGLLYVEPVYIERANQEAAFPQLNRVLAAFGDRIGYAPTLRQALDKIFGAGAGDASTTPDQQTQPPAQGSSPDQGTSPPPAAGPAGNVSPEMRQAINEIVDALDRLRTAQAAGDFRAQGQALADLDAATRRFDAAQSGGSGSPPPPAPAPGGGG
jgi:uncharacterized membrane protein (UPF0182 family)